MLSLKRLSSGNSSYAYVVACQLPDGKDHHITKTKKFECNGADDLEAQTKAIWFAKATDSLLQFRAFLFDEPGGYWYGRGDGTMAVDSAVDRTGGPASSISLVDECQTGSDKTRVRSFVCMRENQLTGVRYAVAMCRLENGQLRSISFNRSRSVYEEGQGRGEDHVLEKASHFLRSVAFENWRKQVSRESLLRIREQAGAGALCSSGRERGLKHPHSFVEIEQGEKVDCVCGKNRSDGLMMACERCGAWEHAECQGFRSNKQIPADYICSACVRAEREEVIVITFEEQGSCWNVALEDLWTDMKIKEQKDDGPVCCVCGCEDSEDFEALIQPCACDGGSSVAHPSCVTMAKAGASQREIRLQGLGSTICLFCGVPARDSVGISAKTTKGAGWTEEATQNSLSLISGTPRSANADQLTMARKRLRSTLVSGGAPVKGESAEKRIAKSCKNERDQPAAQLTESQPTQPDATALDLKKPASPFLGRRFSDAAANVPIKKRRIQLEMARSPSPPLRSTAPRAQPDIPAVNEVAEIAQLNGSQSPEDANMVTVGQADDDGLAYDGVVSSSVGCVQQCTPGKSGTLPENQEHEQIVGNGKDNDATLPVRMSHEVDTVGPDVVSFGTFPDVGLHVSPGFGLPKMDLVVQSSSEKGQGKPQQSEENRDVAENGTYPAGRPTEEASSCLGPQVDLQQQPLTPAQVGSDNSSEERQANVMKRSEVFASPLKTGDAGPQSELAVQETGGDVTPSDLPKEKAPKDDPHCPVGDHLRVDEGPRKLRAAHSKGDQSHGTCRNLEEHVCAMEENENMNFGPGSLAGKSSCMRDVRLHWDLNMDMEEWERPPQENKPASADLDLLVPSENGKEKITRFSGEQVEQGKAGCELGPVRRSEQGRVENVEDGSKASASDADRGSLKPDMQIGAKHEPIFPESRKTSSTLGAGALSHTCRPISEHVQEHGSRIEPHGGSGYGDFGRVKVIDLEVKVLAHEEPSLVVSSLVDREANGMAPLDMGNVKTEVDGSISVVTDGKAGLTCVDAGEGFSGASGKKGVIGDRRKGLPAFLQPEQKLELSAQHPNLLDHPEEDVRSASVEPVTLPMFETSSVKDVLGSQGCGEDEGPAYEHENVVDKEVTEECFKDRKELLSSPSRQGPNSHKWEGNMSEDLEAENVDYDDSEVREGDELESEDRLQCGGSEVESTWKPATLTGCPPEEPRKADSPWKQGASVSQTRRSETDGWTNSGPPNKKRHQSGSIGAEEDHIRLHRRDACAVGADIDSCGGFPGPKLSSTPDVKVDVNCVAEDEEGGDAEHGNGIVSMATSNSHLGSLERKEDTVKKAPSEKAARKSEVWKRSFDGSRVKSSGWDQLPKGFESAEEALQAARGNTGHKGWGSQNWSGPSGWNANADMHFSSSNNRFVSGHGRGVLLGNGAAADRVRFEDTAWSRDDHLRRCRVDEGFEMSGRVPPSQELRQGSGSRARPGAPPFESAHRQRRREHWVDDSSANPPLWGFSPVRHLSPPGPLSEPFGFKARNAAAVAAAKVESSGLVVAPDGTIIKAGAGVQAQAPVRGSSILAGKGRGGGHRGTFLGIGDMPSNGAIPGGRNAGLGGRMRARGDMDLRGRECLGVDTRVAPGINMGAADCTGALLRYEQVGDRFGSSFSSSRMPGTSSRFRWSREERGFASPVEQEDKTFLSRRRESRTYLPSQPRVRSRSPRASTPPRAINSGTAGSADAAACQLEKGSCTPSISTRGDNSRPDVVAEKLESPSHQVVPPPPKLPLPPPPPRAQRSPPAGLKRLINRRETDWPRGRERNREKERDWDRERLSLRGHHSPPRRTSPHVVHGSALTDERDRQLLAGIGQSTPSERSLRPRDQGASSPAPTQDMSTSHGLRDRSVEGAREARKSQGDEGRKQDAGAHMSRDDDSLPSKPRVHSKEVPVRGGGDVKDRRSETSSYPKAGREAGTSTRAQSSDTDRDGPKSGGSFKYSSSREGEDDVAPRRRRPSY